ncbi:MULTISPECIES: NupC/NupG family nucleoside CNT transporter [Bacteria]|uniref:NupC/NupG family nucleoside CNT transporter n=2 Tax=Turicibacter sanguinis TaxID=154288 RepID=A0A6G2CBK9_9FIRM|nr:nucleoside transporter C-terminal domain-containing protein [Turicibacter sanguinis]KAA3384524.1 NupC/NupG family nucleoside CNT transporter [Akkermansia muciniphila]KAB3585090.1 NupC/NupG family nucleoside CNT transporter [Phocaeicola vulgatus]EFF64503.1 nucleoside transporter, NupC family [Turicibacter sanguinis PC909]MCU7190922.1 NupC/NupG family nucleoside CNT transporter [Turicibacter sanguinis]MTK20291.1 NupC/NupG family nucleoside CNT transporter [Turicibacter sanguinis]
MNILFSILALVCLLGIAFILSTDKKSIKVQTVVMGLLLQIILIFFVIKVPVGQVILENLAMGVNSIVQMGMEGVNFVFGGISDSYVFAINVLSLIVFTSALISVLYFLKVIPFLVKYVGKSVAKLMGTTDVETFAAVGNCFLSGTESPLLIKPYLPKLTKSELFAVMVGGFGSASASILAGYALMGIDMRYLLIAVFTVPFSTLMVSKIMVPETEKSLTENAEVSGSESDSLFEAISEGTGNGLGLALNVGASLIAFVGLIAVINAFLGLFDTNLSQLFGYVFLPFAYLFHVPSNEAFTFATLVGTKFGINEFVAYGDMVNVMGALSPRTNAILAVVLCNFANISSIGIQVGGFNSFAPTRKKEVAKLGFKALICGTIATLTTGAILGMFI